MDSFYCNNRTCDDIENVLAKDDEDLSKDTKEITHTFMNINLKSDWFMNTINLNQSDFMRFKRRTLDSLNKYQQKTMILNVLLVILKHKDEVLQNQLEDKKVDVEKLKTELISQVEEQEQPNEDSEEL